MAAKRMGISTRATALVRAEHGAAPAHLTKQQRSVLNEGLRRGEDVRELLEATVTSYGRWILADVFGDDAASALDGGAKNAVWLELVRRAGGPTLRISRRILYVALAVAAHDKRMTDQSWRGLDAGRKELLLPLGDAGRLREAAQHVARFNLTQTKTREYVTELMRSDGRTRQVRLTAPRLLARVRTLHAALDQPAVFKKIGQLGKTVSDAERQRIAKEMDQLRDVLMRAARALRGEQ